MKKILPLFLLILCICTSCAASEPEESVDISEALKIRTWLLDEELEGTADGGIFPAKNGRIRAKRTATATGSPTTA